MGTTTFTITSREKSTNKNTDTLVDNSGNYLNDVTEDLSSGMLVFFKKFPHVKS